MKHLLNHRFVVGSALALVVGFGMIACNKDKNQVGVTNPVSGLMAFNLASDKSVSVTLSGNPIANTPLAFTGYTGNYLTVFSGPRLVQSFDYTTGGVLDSVTYNFVENKYYSLFVTGANGHYHNFLVNDNYDSLNTSQANIRYVSAIADSSAPAVTVSANGANVVQANASFGTVSAFTPVTAGDVTVSISNGGTYSKSRTFTVDQHKAYTVLLAGNPASAGPDSLQIRYVENGTLTQGTQKASTAGSANTN
ncbi:MAG TPA: DUF4397 domain-containing protein [Chitinophagaceae bacterium]|jgi:hypothetical protein